MISARKRPKHKENIVSRTPSCHLPTVRRRQRHAHAFPIWASLRWRSRNFAEAAEDFASTIGTNTDTRVLLGRQIAIADYVNGDPSLPLYSRADGYQESGEVSSDGKTGDGRLNFFSWDGFSANNLNKLLSKSSDPSDYGVVPAVHLDLREIPECEWNE